MDFDALLSSSDQTTKQKWYGSGIRPLGFSEDDDLRNFKESRTDDANFSLAKTMHQQKMLRSDGQQMLSFGSSNNAQPLTFPCYYPHSYTRNTGAGGLLSGNSISTTNMHGLLTTVRGPFTPSQWMELEHQALIYKYITANAPIPSNLLIPIRKALESACFSGGYLRQNAFWWGGYPLGLSGNNDPEPGRCRRTDGKKWRCSRDAVPDQKYCERHMNRGRHRSRKPVEGPNGHPVSGATTAKNIPAALRVAAGGGTSSGIASVIPSASSILNRDYLNKVDAAEKVQEAENLFMENPFSLPKHAYEDLTTTEFGLVCSDSLLNPLHKSSITDPETKSQNSLRQFMDDFPKNQTKSNPSFWLDTHSDRTQLSISIPTDLSLSRELDPIHMGLGMEVGRTGLTAPDQREAQWVPISWENSLGGPLGEVLHSNTSSGLNLGWDSYNTSPPIGSSPTGVLQKATFRSLSNSSAGSSPRADHNICNNYSGSGLINSTLPTNLI